jgi:WD40 repeat protein
MPVDAKRVQAAFLAVVEATDAAQQAAILDRECAADPELRDRVEALLRAHHAPASILQRPAVEPEGNGAAGLSAALTQEPHQSPELPDAIDLRFLAPPTQPGALGRLGHYEIFEVLGRGGFGIVLRAFDEVLQRVVAVKVLAPEIAATSPARKRFLREARGYAAVRHENVVQVYAVEEQPLPYLVMEFIPGRTLQRLLDDSGPLELPEILRIGGQIGEGLASAHANSLIHRDVKPANVLLEDGPERRVKLTDFGLVRSADDASISQSGLVAGTPLYMSPEQANGAALDHRADLFSFGSVLYVMCTGRPPFRASSTMAILKRVCDDMPRPIREIIPETPAWLCELISQLHAKDPAMRIQTAREVVDLLKTQQRAGTADAKGTTIVHHVERRGSRRKLLGVVAAVAVFGVVALGLWVRHMSGWGTPGEMFGPPPVAWQPRPVSAEELARQASPFDALERTNLPREALARMIGDPDRAPPDLVALIDSSPTCLPRPARTSWFAEDREGKWLAVPCDNEVLLFNRQTLKREKVFTGASERVYRVAFSPDGKRLAAACWPDKDSGLVWDVDTCEVKLRLPLQGTCKSIQFSPDGTRLLTVGEDTTPILLDAGSGEQVKHFAPHNPSVWPDATYTTDGAYIITRASGGFLHVWNTTSWEKKVLEGPESPAENLEGRHLPLAVSADGKWLAAGSESGYKVWEIATWKEQPGAKTTATWIAFTPDGRTLLTGPHDCANRQLPAVTRWDTQTGQRLPGGVTLGSRGPWAVYHLSADGKTLYGMACDPAEPAFRVYDAGTGQERQLPGHVGRVCAVDVSPDGAWIASAGADGSVRLWDVVSGRMRHTVARAGRVAAHAVFSPDGTALYAGWAEDGIIRAIDPASGEWHQLGVYGPDLQRLAIAPDGALLAAAGEGGVRLWALPDGAPRGELQGVPRSAGPIAFSPDARTMAVGGPESVRFFDLASRRLVRTLDFSGMVRWLGFRPDGRTLAVAGETTGNVVLLFDTATGAVTQRLQGHHGMVSNGAWRADGGLLATVATGEGTLRLWDLGHAPPRERVIQAFEPDVHNVEGVALTRDGRHLVTANSDGSISVFRLAQRTGP